jgi:uncharacterized C2H2 Zn-finger protein
MSKDKGLKCSYCGEVFFNKDELKRHIVEKHFPVKGTEG